MRILLHSHFPVGHAYNMQAIAKELIDRGHHVVWLTSADHEKRAEITGAEFVPTRKIAVVDDLLSRQNETGLLDHRYDRLKHRLSAQVADYRSILAQGPVDLVLVDVFPFGAQALYELGEIPAYATLGVIPLYLSSRRAPLARSGGQPPKWWLGRMMLCLRHWFVQWLLLPTRLRPIINRQRSTLGLPNLPYGQKAEHFRYSPQLHIQASSPLLEFVRTETPKRVSWPTVFVGPVYTHQNAAVGVLPPWWDEVVAHPKVVGITQGTLAVDPTSLIIPAIQALCDFQDLLLVVTTSYGQYIEASLPGLHNVRMTPWIPYHVLLPQLCLLITNGGYGSVTQALSHGVPLLCSGQTEDKKDTAARVAWSGAGIDLETDAPSVKQIRSAAYALISEESYRTAAASVMKELNTLGGAKQACDALEDLASKVERRSISSLDAM